jgi:hypothetical protein
MKVTLNIPDAQFAPYQQASDLILKNRPFIKPTEATPTALIELLIVSDLPHPDRNNPAKLARRFEKALLGKYKTHALSDDPLGNDDDDLPPDDGTGTTEETKGQTPPGTIPKGMPPLPNR